MRNQHGLFSPRTYDALLALHHQYPLSLERSGYLPPLQYSVIRADSNVLLPADFNARGIYRIIIIKSVTNSSHLRTAQLLSVPTTEGGEGGRMDLKAPGNGPGGVS